MYGSNSVQNPGPDDSFSTNSPEESSKDSRENNILSTIGFFLALIGLGVCGFFMYVQFGSGSKIYQSPSISISNPEFSDDVKLSPEGNTYRIILKTNLNRVQTSGVGSERLLDYQFKLSDSDSAVIQKDSFVSFDSEGETSNSTIAQTLGRFDIENEDDYNLLLTTEFLDENYFGELSAFIIVKQNVKSLPTWVIIVGGVLFFLGVLLLIISGKKKTANNSSRTKISKELNLSSEEVNTSSPLLRIQQKFVFNCATLAFLFLYLVIAVVISGFLGIVIGMIFSTSVSIILIIVSSVLIFGSLVITAILNASKSYYEFFSDTIHIYQYKKNLIFLKPKIKDIYRSYNTITHLAFIQNGQIDIYFKDGFKTSVTSPDIDNDSWSEIKGYVSNADHQFSIIDSNGLDYNLAFNEEFIFGVGNQNLRSLILERKTVYEYLIKDNFGKVVANLEVDRFDNITKEYRIYGPQKEQLWLKGSYLGVKPGGILGLAPRVKAFKVQNRKNMVLSLAFMDEKLLPISSDFEIQFGTRKVKYKSKGLVNEQGIISNELLPDVKFEIKKLKREMISVNTLNNASLPLRFGLILLLILYADVDYTGAENDD
jgi:hypothetical protein